MLMNLRETEDQKIYISSDFHLGHKQNFVWEARGYDSVKAHDDGVINSVNELVRPDDILLFLGDFCLNTQIEQFDAYLERFNCKNIWMLWGNHNNPHQKKVYHATMEQLYPSKSSKLPFPIEAYPFQYKNITYLGYYVEAVLNGQYAILQHYPIYIFNEMSHGAWMLCGHSHNGCPLSQIDNTSGKILDTGWDGHGRPWSLKEIDDVMKTRPFQPLDKHHK